MESKEDLEKQVLLAARDQGINSVLFRHAIRRKLGLNVADNECLSFLTIHGVATPTELARYTGLTTGSTTVMLDRLEKAGFITRKPNPNDRRGVLVEINPKWTNTVGPFIAGIQKANNALIARYSDKELEILADFLIRFAANLKEQTASVEQGVS